MRAIHCEACAIRHETIFKNCPATPEDPAKFVRRTDGDSTVFTLCDSCNDQIKPGDKITAWSMWLEGRDIAIWEHEYLRMAI